MTAPTATLRSQLADMLVKLRGDVSRAALARRLEVTRQAVMKIESGSVSLERLDELAAVYGIRFEVVAVFPDGTVVRPGQECPAAPALANLEP